MRQRPLPTADLNIGRSSSVTPLALIGGGRLPLPFIQAGWNPQRISSRPVAPSWLRMTGTDWLGETLKRGRMSVPVSDKAPRPKRAAMSSGEVSVYLPHIEQLYCAFVRSDEMDR